MDDIKRKLELASIKNVDPFDESKRDEDLVIDEDESNPVRISKSLVYRNLKRGLSDRMILPMAADFFQGGIHSVSCRSNNPKATNCSVESHGYNIQCFSLVQCTLSMGIFI